MTSLILPDPPEQPSGPAPVATPEPVVEAPPEVVAPPEDPEFFDRSYVEELRRENAGYRTRARDYEQAFDGYDDDTRDQLLEYFRLAPLAEQGDTQAAARIQEMFGGDDGADDSAPDPLSPPEPVDYRKIAREEAENFYTEREQQRMQQEGVAAVRKAGEDLGYEYGTDDYILFVKGANEAAMNGGEDPIAAGDVAVKAHRQAIIDAYLASKGEQADHSAQVPAGVGAAPNLSQKPWDDTMSEAQRFAAVRESAMERFRNSAG